MRNRSEIVRDTGGVSVIDGVNFMTMVKHQRLLIEIGLDIRDLLIEKLK